MDIISLALANNNAAGIGALKVDIDQGVENAGKVLGIGADGKVAPASSCSGGTFVAGNGIDITSGTISVKEAEIDYTKLDNLPTIPADVSDRVTTVEFLLDGHSVGKNVPANAVFTDTVYDDTYLAQRVTSTELALTNKVDKITGKQLSTEDYSTAEKTKLSNLENYDDTGIRGIVNGKQDIISDLADIRSGASAGANAVQPADLTSYQTTTITDPAGYYATDTVEGALAEIGSTLDGLDLALANLANGIGGLL